MSKNRNNNLTKQDRGYFPLFKLIPNMVTLAALCVGLSSIQYAIHDDFIKATSFLLLAGFMDGIDGRLARFLNSSSDFGAQLDSLADFLNFGVAPGFIIYAWVNSYEDIKGWDWALVLFFAVCGAIRLARFNVDSQKSSIDPILEKYFFKGIPAPCGAAMAMLPMVLTYEFGDGFYSSPFLVIFYTAFLALMMASRIPTISIKKIPIRNEYVYPTLLVLVSIVIGLLEKPWLTLAIVGTVYGFSIPITVFAFFRIKSKKENLSNLATNSNQNV